MAVVNNLIIQYGLWLARHVGNTVCLPSHKIHPRVQGSADLCIPAFDRRGERVTFVRHITR